MMIIVFVSIIILVCMRAHNIKNWAWPGDELIACHNPSRYYIIIILVLLTSCLHYTVIAVQITVTESCVINV